jgi:hypothetical protein
MCFDYIQMALKQVFCRFFNVWVVGRLHILTIFYVIFSTLYVCDLLYKI